MVFPTISLSTSPVIIIHVANLLSKCGLNVLNGEDESDNQMQLLLNMPKDASLHWPAGPCFSNFYIVSEVFSR